MKFTSLFSGSSGNCSLIESKDSKILLDVGVSYTKIKKVLHEVNLTPTDIDAVFITHEHSDHISGLSRWLLYNSARPVFVHERGYEALSQKTQWKSYSVFNKEFVFRDIRVSTYECCHDSAYCCGYRFFDTTGDIAVVTDTGVATMALVDFVRGARTVMLESNYDAELLLEGNYPYMLKQRIMSEHGHLSNEQNSQIV
ncbi:MAG: MBL fold metallo-hydrolase, partial [Clostridia bacterium]